MKLMLTTNGRLYKNSKGEYYTPMVYDYSFFRRYLSVFEEIRLVAHVEQLQHENSNTMLRVDGQGVEIFEVPFPHGKIQYILNYLNIASRLKNAAKGCDAAIFRIPDQLAFQALSVARKARLPIGVEVTSNSWEFFEKDSITSAFRPLIRILWDRLQKRACKTAIASSYVTRNSIQKRYKPNKSLDSFSTHCSSVDITLFRGNARNYGNDPLKSLRCLHVAGSINTVAKGHGELLQAAAILKKNGISITCVLIGGGELSRENGDYIMENSIDVEIKGLLSACNIAQEMQNADLFVFPSYREGLPRVVIEAMAVGLPCITTNLEGIKELLDECVMVPVRDAEALASKILFCANNPSFLTDQSARNMKLAEEFAPERLEERRKEFYCFLRQKANKHYA